jgi:hypothetical protein
MAERSFASPGVAWPALTGCPASSRAIRWIIIFDGDDRSAVAFGVKENPVTAPPALRLTTAVACCHQGFLAELIGSPPSWHRGGRGGWPGPSRAD